MKKKITKNHYLFGILFLILIAFFIYGKTNVKAKEKEIYHAAEKTATNDKDEEQIPCLNGDMLLYKGETRYLDIKCVGGASTVTIQSSSPSVVAVSKNGQLEAKKCGSSVITVTMKRGNKTNLAKINVKVKYSSFFSSGNYAKAINQNAKNKKSPQINLHVEQEKGITKKLSLSGIESDAKISYKSNNPSVASVDALGNITSINYGKATIQIKINQNKKTYIYHVTLHINQEKNNVSVTQSDIDKYIGKSAFIGNSVCLGLKYYFNTKESSFLGGPLVLARECYNFIIDSSSSYSQYKPSYKGVPDNAANLIAKSKVKYAFINMGTNDLGITGLDGTYKNYVNYLKKIKDKNPNVILFVESMTPMYKGSDVGSLNNKNIDKLNEKLEAYCKTQPDIFYIDISSALKKPDGTMKSEYSSDSYVHITMAGYAVWTKEVCNYVSELLTKERLAQDAVKTVLQSKDKTDYEDARKLVNALDDGSVKKRLSGKLDNIKDKLR